MPRWTWRSAAPAEQRPVPSSAVRDAKGRALPSLTTPALWAPWNRAGREFRGIHRQSFDVGRLRGLRAGHVGHGPLPAPGPQGFTELQDGRRFATPLLRVLVAVELTDVLFAVDSVPAIFAVTTDPFIVFTSNIFAILGLRSLYFLLAGVVGQFHPLKVGLSLVLVFVGLKMLVADLYKMPIAWSLRVIAGLVWSAEDAGPCPRAAPGKAGGGAAPAAPLDALPQMRHGAGPASSKCELFSGHDKGRFEAGRQMWRFS